MNEFTSILNEKTCLAGISKHFKFQVPTPASKVPRSIAEREDPQAVTVTAAARSAATQRGLRGPVCRHRGSHHAARSAVCGEELRGASAKRWRSVAECMHGAKERSQREALAECSDAVMSNLFWSLQTPGGTAVSCYATSLPLPLSPSASTPFPVRASVTV